MATSPLFGWEEPDDTDLVKDGAAAIRTLGNAIDTSMGDLLGGTTGQVLSKASNTNMDFTWVDTDDTNAIQNAIVDAKGDLIAASAADTPARLAVGANNTVLIADSAESTGLRWGGAWASYTSSPTGITVGNGTVTARYAQIGKTVSVEFNFTLGSTSAITGNPQFALPVAAKMLGYTFAGTGTLGDYGTASYYAGLNLIPGDRVNFSSVLTSGTYAVEAGVSATVPFTWTTNDYLSARLTYEAA